MRTLTDLHTAHVLFWLTALLRCLVLSVLITVGLRALSGCDRAGSSTSTSAPVTETVTIKGESFALELAIDSDSRKNGLMHRTSVADAGGMLFVFPDSEVTIQRFWMAHCPIDIDVIFLDPRGTVTATHRMKAEPPRAPDESEADYGQRLPRYSSAYPAQFAIELKAGTVHRLNVNVDDRIALDLPRLKAMAR